jgi:hypothetical protein
VPDAAAGARVWDRSQNRQKPQTVAAQNLRSSEQLANGGVGQG